MTAALLSTGTMVSRYRVISRIGAGGMGEVYKAHDHELDRPVAIKILPFDVVRHEDRVRRFIQEARAASALSHPHIVTIHEIGEIDLGAGGSRTRYIAMEYIHGATLRERIHDGRTSIRALLDVLSQAADALAKAHAAGIVHRDLKPDNIMVTQDGYAKVVDFGLAKLTEKASTGDASAVTVHRQTQEGMLLGTIAYMSPEQARGEAVDHRSDIFSFGCVLYEAVTKRRPFDAELDDDILHRIVHSDPIPVSEIAPSTPAEVRRMIRRCLARDPDQRYQSMKDLAIELRELSEEFESLAPRSGSASGELSPARPGRPLLMLLAAVVAVAILLGAYAVIQRRASSNGTAPASSATFRQLTDQAGLEWAPSLSPDGKFVAYVAASERGDSDIYLLRIGGRKAINLTEDSPAEEDTPVFSPDGQSIAFRSSRQGGGIFVMGATGESVRRLTGEGHDPSWSPDGKSLVISSLGFNNPLSRTSSVGELSIVDAASGARRKLGVGHDAVQPNWSPGGHRIVFWSTTQASGRRDIASVPAGGGPSVAITSDEPADWNPVWSPDGKFVYFCSDRGGTMNIWRIAVDEVSGQVQGEPQPVTAPTRWAGDLSFERSGRTLAFSAIDSRSNIEKLPYDPVQQKATGAPTPVTRGNVKITEPDVSPDGRQIAFRTDLQQEDIYVVGTDGSNLQKLTDDIARDRRPRWSPDGKRIGFYSNRSGRYELWTMRTDGSDRQQITSSTGPWVADLVWSPDGTRLALYHANRGAYLVSLADQLPSSKFEPLPASPGAFFRPTDWSHDGEWLLGRMQLPDGTLQPGVVAYSFRTRTYTRVSRAGGFGRWLGASTRFLFNDDKTMYAGEVGSDQVRKIVTVGNLFPAAASRDGSTIYLIREAVEGDIWLMAFQ